MGQIDQNLQGYMNSGKFFESWEDDNVNSMYCQNYLNARIAAERLNNEYCGRNVSDYEIGLMAPNSSLDQRDLSAAALSHNVDAFLVDLLKKYPINSQSNFLGIDNSNKAMEYAYRRYNRLVLLNTLRLNNIGSNSLLSEMDIREKYKNEIDKGIISDETIVSAVKEFNSDRIIDYISEHTEFGSRDLHPKMKSDLIEEYFGVDKYTSNLVAFKYNSKTLTESLKNSFPLENGKPLNLSDIASIVGKRKFNPNINLYEEAINKYNSELALLKCREGMFDGTIKGKTPLAQFDKVMIANKLPLENARTVTDIINTEIFIKESEKRKLFKKKIKPEDLNNYGIDVRNASLTIEKYNENVISKTK